MCAGSVQRLLAESIVALVKTPGSIRVSSSSVRDGKSLCFWRGRHFGEGHPNAGRFRAMNFPLFAYIEFSYKLTEDQNQFLLPQLPKWLTADRFDIQASVQGNPTTNQIRLMMQSLLAD